jgi:hypothetical protein
MRSARTNLSSPILDLCPSSPAFGQTRLSALLATTNRATALALLDAQQLSSYRDVVAWWLRGWPASQGVARSAAFPWSLLSWPAIVSPGCPLSTTVVAVHVPDPAKLTWSRAAVSKLRSPTSVQITPAEEKDSTVSAACRPVREQSRRSSSWSQVRVAANRRLQVAEQS